MCLQHDVQNNFWLLLPDQRVNRNFLPNPFALYLCIYAATIATGIYCFHFLYLIVRRQFSAILDTIHDSSVRPPNCLHLHTLPTPLHSCFLRRSTVDAVYFSLAYCPEQARLPTEAYEQVPKTGFDSTHCSISFHPGDKLNPNAIAVFVRIFVIGSSAIAKSLNRLHQLITG